MTVSIPTQPLDVADTEGKVEMFARQAKHLEDSVRSFFTMAGECSKKMAGRNHFFVFLIRISFIFNFLIHDFKLMRKVRVLVARIIAS